MLAFMGGSGGSSSKWQQDASDVSDPSDWVGGSFAFLKDLDASLRCEICSDIIRAPVSIKRCNHTFCSRCIRDYINQPAASGAPTDRPCPNCRQPKVYDSELVPVPQLEVAAEAWRQARPALSRTAYEVQQQQRRAQATSPPSEDRSSEPASSSAKRRRVGDATPQAPTASTSKNTSNPNRRVTRSATGAVRQRSSASPSKNRDGSVEGEAIVVDDESEEEWKPDGISSSPSRSKRSPRTPANGSASSTVNGEGRALKDVQASDIAECPVCCHTFTLLALNRHLDTPGACKGPGSSPPSDRERGFSSSNGAGKSPSGFGGWFEKSKPGSIRSQGKSTSTSATKPSSASAVGAEEPKLKRPQYHLLSEQKLRKLCDEFSLTTSGSRQTLESRHRRWIDIYNANLDASPAFRRTEGQLRRDIKEWDREREKEDASSRGGGGSSGSHGSNTVAGGRGGGGGSAKTKANVLVGASEEERRAYTVAHATHFRELIAQSRKTHAQNKRVHSGPDGGAAAEESSRPPPEESKAASTLVDRADPAATSSSTVSESDAGAPAVAAQEGESSPRPQASTDSSSGGGGGGGDSPSAAKAKSPTKVDKRPAESEGERDSQRSGLLEDMGDFFEESMEY